MGNTCCGGPSGVAGGGESALEPGLASALFYQQQARAERAELAAARERAAAATAAATAARSAAAALTAETTKTDAACATFTAYNPFFGQSSFRPREVGIQVNYKY